jgi:hypothetical protein
MTAGPTIAADAFATSARTSAATSINASHRLYSWNWRSCRNFPCERSGGPAKPQSHDGASPPTCSALSPPPSPRSRPQRGTRIARTYRYPGRAARSDSQTYAHHQQQCSPRSEDKKPCARSKGRSAAATKMPCRVDNPTFAALTFVHVW